MIMTNEELVSQIQKGERDLLPQLWEGVRRYVAKVARSYMVLYDGRYGVELDDLIQSGFIAMVNAAETYRPGEANFLTWLKYHVKTVFAEATNRRTKAQKKDPLHVASSLYELLSGDEDGEVLLMDTIPAPDAFEDVEAKIYREQLRNDLEAVLSTIPQRNADVLRLYFFEDKELAEIAESQGISAAAVGAYKRDGLQKMRQKTNTKQGAKLKAYIEERMNYYNGMGLRRFMNTSTSPIEAAVLSREHLENKFFAPVFVPEWCYQGNSGKWRAEGVV